MELNINIPDPFDDSLVYEVQCVDLFICAVDILRRIFYTLDVGVDSNTLTHDQERRSTYASSRETKQPAQALSFQSFLRKTLNLTNSLC
ncbi:hypothetical protein VNO78_27416 [Psophocarpus tetragonolobus]|uniref:Uncharacterized protein n=1 Tax=Psophocarpus tetragonolobus TaxID=3891 RepID=A0AAN9S2N3_PSOTE